MIMNKHVPGDGSRGFSRMEQCPFLAKATISATVWPTDVFLVVTTVELCGTEQ